MKNVGVRIDQIYCIHYYLNYKCLNFEFYGVCMLWMGVLFYTETSFLGVGVIYFALIFFFFFLKNEFLGLWYVENLIVYRKKPTLSCCMGKSQFLAIFDKFWLWKSPKVIKRTPEVSVVIVIKRKYQIRHLLMKHKYSRGFEIENYVNLRIF